MAQGDVELLFFAELDDEKGDAVADVDAGDEHDDGADHLEAVIDEELDHLVDQGLQGFHLLHGFFLHSLRRRVFCLSVHDRGEGTGKARRKRERAGGGALFDGEKALEAEVFHHRDDIHEPGPFHEVEVALGGERLEDSLEAARLVDDLLRGIAPLDLVVGVEAGQCPENVRRRRAPFQRG